MPSSLRPSFVLHRTRDFALIGIFLFLLIQNGLPAIRALAQDADAEPRASTPLTDAFTYQGRFEQNGVPVTGTYDFEFSLFDAATGGTALTTLPVLSGVPVNNGLFTVQLNFGSSQFQGSQRWLNVRARPNAQSAFTSLGRAELTDTPYALYAKNIPLAGDGSATTAARSDHDHLGQNWTSGQFYRAFQVTSTDQDVGASALSGISTGEFTAGVLGENDFGGVGVTGAAVRKAGVNNPDRAIGVVGRSCDAGPVCAYRDGEAAKAGVYGESTSGAGVFGIGVPNIGGPYDAGVVGLGEYGVSGNGGEIGVAGAGATGVNGHTDSPVGASLQAHAGVFGNAFNNGCTNVGGSITGYCVGVWGESTYQSAAIGVYGAGNRVGLYGTAPASGFAVFASGSTYSTNGVYQTSDANLKTDTADSAGLAEILALEPHSYRWSNADMDDGKRHEGLFAQEVLDVLPDLVTYVEGPDTSNYAVNYTELIPVLIHAIQEQQAEIDALKGGR